MKKEKDLLKRLILMHLLLMKITLKTGVAHSKKILKDLLK